MARKRKAPPAVTRGNKPVDPETLTPPPAAGGKRTYKPDPKPGARGGNRG